jgi:ketosteroid isomerase-like protein
VEPDAPTVIRRGIELFNRREYEESIATLSPAIEWDTTDAVPDGRLYAGREDVLALWRDIDSRWHDFRIETERWIEGDRVILVLGRLVARGAESGVPVEQPWDQVWRIEDDVPIRCENYTDRAKAWRAAGLEPDE